ncbi:defective proboscis extension response 10 isoform X4 [Musca autumnalis]|uniref:defective proboscis extension response 10 isoform X4 n=1 Tax=Musca autumnalis TaxID=221902 RepID=UPI003CF8525C
MIAFLTLFFYMTSLSMCYQRLSGNPNHNNVDQKPTHLPPGHYSHGHRWNEPYFDVTMPKNITSLVGKSAYLGCRVKHLGNKTVAWIRHRDLHILTVGTYTYTTDQRFQTSYHRDIDEWTLQIKWAQQRDAGVYECQISTQPVRSFSVHLNIVVPTATILGGPDLYVDKGSTINLTCVIKFSTEPPTHIFWYHQDKVLSEETSGGRLKFKTIKSEETKSILLIDDANISDSGKYSCYPSNTEIASIRVHVLQGERPEAMQTNAAASPKVRTSNQFAIILTAFGMTFALLRMLATLCHIFIANCHRIRSDSSNGSITTIKAKSKCRSKSNRNSIYTRNDNCDTAHVDASDETAYSDDNINDFEKCNAVDCYKKRTSDTLWNSTVNGSLPQKKEIQKDIFSYTLPIKWSERHDLR